MSKRAWQRKRAECDTMASNLDPSRFNRHHSLMRLRMSVGCYADATR